MKPDMAKVSIVQEKQPYTVGRNSILAAVSAGALVGIFGWLLELGVKNWVLSPVFCRSADTSSVCANIDITAWIIAFVVISVVGLFMLIRASVFRPLLVVLAALATLWLVGLWFAGAPWWIGMIWHAGLFAVAYALYTWLASIDKFVISLVSIVVIVALMRLLFIF